MPAYAGGQVRGGRLLFTKLCRQLRQVCVMPLRQHPAQPTGCRSGGAIPDARWPGGLRRRRVREDAPRQQRQGGQTLPTGRGKDALPCCPTPLRGPQWQPLHRPAVPIHGLRWRATAGQRRVEEYGVGKAGVVENNRGKGRGARWGVRQDEMVPALRREKAGLLPRAALPGLAPVGGGGRARALLLGPWQRPDHGAFGRAAALATGRRQRGASGGTVGRATTARPGEACRVALRQRNAPIRHKECVGGQARWRLASPLSRQRGFAWMRCCGTHQEAGPGPAVGPCRAATGRDAHGDGGEGLAGLGAGVRRHTPLPAWPPEAHEVTGDWAVAPMPMGVPGAVVLEHARPGGQALRCVPAPIGESGPCTPHGRSGEPQVGEPRENRPTALEQAAAEEPPQQVEEAQIGANGHTRHDRRQKAVETVAYGRQQVRPFSKRCVRHTHSPCSLACCRLDLPLFTGN